MSRFDLQIAVGSYTGNATDNTSITGAGFASDFLMIKGGANHTVFKTFWMQGDTTGYMANNVANFANGIQAISADGFTVGDDATVNASSTTYYYLAIRGSAAQQYFRVGQYSGNGSDNRDFTTGAIGFTPDFVFTKGNTNSVPVWRSVDMGSGDTSAFFSGAANTTNLIQNLQSGGFQLGAASNVNSNTVLYNFLALKKYNNAIVMGSFLGDGRDNRGITGIGFQPSAVIIKNGDGATQGRFRNSSVSGDSTGPFGAAAFGTDWIQSLDTDGFTMGISGNTANQTHYYVAFRVGNFNVPLTRATS